MPLKSNQTRIEPEPEPEPEPESIFPSRVYRCVQAKSKQQLQNPPKQHSQATVQLI